MTKASKKELEDSIYLLEEYKKRITKELLDIGEKLRVPKTNIEQTLTEHKELNLIKKMILKLKEKGNI